MNRGIARAPSATGKRRWCRWSGEGGRSPPEPWQTGWRKRGKKSRSGRNYPGKAYIPHGRLILQVQAIRFFERQYGFARNWCSDLASGAPFVLGFLLGFRNPHPAPRSDSGPRFQRPFFRGAIMQVFRYSDKVNRHPPSERWCIQASAGFTLTQSGFRSSFRLADAPSRFLGAGQDRAIYNVNIIR